MVTNATNRLFDTFADAKKLLVPRSVNGVIEVTRKELDDYEALFPPSIRQPENCWTLNGHKLVLKP